MSAAIADPGALAGAAAPAGKRGKKKLFIIVGAVLAVVLAAGGGTVVYLKKKAAHAAALAEEEGEGGAASAAGPKIDAKNPPAYLPLDPFVVNLADRDADRYAQIGITLELDPTAAADQIKGYMPGIRNAILLVLASKTSKDLLDRSGKEQLAEEIMREAVRPMGIDIAAPMPVTAASAASQPEAKDGKDGKDKDKDKDKDKEAKDGDAPKAKKPKAVAVQKNPIQRVHFSSFIVQ